MKNKKTLFLTTMAILLIIFNLTPVYALQSTSKGTAIIASNTENLTNLKEIITAIRQMEQGRAGLGLVETINENTLLSDTSNNIDVHMLKNTEYGAAVILGASNYGKQGELNTNATKSRYMNKGEITVTGTGRKASSTGNVYGVYELGYGISEAGTIISNSLETVAGVGNNYSTSVDARYINRYSGKGSAKVGDATEETKGWHGSDEYSMPTNVSKNMNRGEGGSPFSYWNTEGNNFRAAIVCGEGF